MSKKLKKSRTVAALKIAATTTMPKEKPAKIKLVIDTTCQGLGKLSWEEVYNLLEKEDPIVK